MKYFLFCKNCIDKPENEYSHVWAGELLWENNPSGHSGFHCSKCKKEFEIKEKIFVSKIREND